MQPLGILRGSFSVSDAVRKGIAFPLAGSDAAFSLVKVIIREGTERVQQDLVPVQGLRSYQADFSPEEQMTMRSWLKNLTRIRNPIVVPSGKFLNWQKPVIQGILNVTPDSFSDGGQFDMTEQALAQADAMAKAGAAIIDIGGESTRPGAEAVTIQQEMDRVLPAIKALKNVLQLISIDSRNAAVMRAALEAGADIINDVSALMHDPESVAVAREYEAPVILMHAQGNPDNMQDDPQYDDVLLDVYDHLEERINFAVQNGLDRDQLIIDPGIGFGKTLDHNVAILKGLSIFHGLGLPILLGVSRKSFIGKLHQDSPADQRLAGTISANQIGLDQGVHILRVHDVSEAIQALNVWSAGR